MSSGKYDSVEVLYEQPVYHVKTGQLCSVCDMVNRDTR